ncbi:PPC domain-containing protein [Planktothrix agardhii]|uniref:PPC domain-containing protein n=1 Tax=Planktothrix agardhii TaxID=1160 RepID=UPI000423336E|nr:PPC domain-containing protein [Planktothrix agardhii]
MRSMLIWTTTMGVFAVLQTPLLDVIKVSNSYPLRGLVLEKVLAQETPNPEPSASPEPPVEETPSPSPEPSPEPSPVLTPPASAPLLLDKQGELKEGDQVLASDKSLYDEYTFEGKEGQQITISLESSEFDPYLALFNSENELLQEHDDISQTNANAEITITLPKTGTYRVIVNAYDSKGRGKYLLKIK